jgi:hypothetical protein
MNQFFSKKIAVGWQHAEASSDQIDDAPKPEMRRIGTRSNTIDVSRQKPGNIRRFVAGDSLRPQITPVNGLAKQGFFATGKWFYRTGVFCGILRRKMLDTNNILELLNNTRNRRPGTGLRSRPFKSFHCLVIAP